jgi:hypothetical protein
MHSGAKIARWSARLADRNVNEKCGSFSDCTFDGDETAVLLHDLVRHR